MAASPSPNSSRRQHRPALARCLHLLAPPLPAGNAHAASSILVMPPWTPSSPRVWLGYYRPCQTKLTMPPCSPTHTAPPMLTPLVLVGRHALQCCCRRQGHCDRCGCTWPGGCEPPPVKPLWPMDFRRPRDAELPLHRRRQASGWPESVGTSRLLCSLPWRRRRTSGWEYKFSPGSIVNFMTHMNSAIGPRVYLREPRGPLCKPARLRLTRPLLGWPASACGLM
jgi:hypothetical protein